MKTKIINFIKNSNTVFSGPLPVECPRCGLFVHPIIQSIMGFEYVPGKLIYCVTFKGDCCGQSFFGLYDINKQSSPTGKLLAIYPTTKSYQLPESIHKISPRFVDMYEQCYTAEQNGHIDLSGSGYRNAIEVLIKDFAINELGTPRDEVVKKKLADAIKAYLPSIDLQQSADVVRILGNDYTHYEQKYDDINFQILKAYVDIFIKSIDTAYLIKHPPVQTQFENKE